MAKTLQRGKTPQRAGKPVAPGVCRIGPRESHSDWYRKWGKTTLRKLRQAPWISSWGAGHHESRGTHGHPCESATNAFVWVKDLPDLLRCALCWVTGSVHGASLNTGIPRTMRPVCPVLTCAIP